MQWDLPLQNTMQNVSHWKSIRRYISRHLFKEWIEFSTTLPTIHINPDPHPSLNHWSLIRMLISNFLSSKKYQLCCDWLLKLLDHTPWLPCDCRNPSCSNPSEWRRGTAWVALPRSVSTAHPLGQWSAVAQLWSQFCLMGKEIKENQEKQTLFSRIKHDKASDKTNDSMVLFGCVEISNPIPHQTFRGWHYRTMLSIETVWQRHKRHKLSWKPTTRSESLKFFPVAGFFIPRV